MQSEPKPNQPQPPTVQDLWVEHNDRYGGDDPITWQVFKDLVEHARQSQKEARQ